MSSDLEALIVLLVKKISALPVLANSSRIICYLIQKIVKIVKIHFMRYDYLSPKLSKAS
jgi:hypothetical protein